MNTCVECGKKVENSYHICVECESLFKEPYGIGEQMAENGDGHTIDYTQFERDEEE